MTNLKKMGVEPLGKPPEPRTCLDCGAKIHAIANPFGGNWWRPAHCPSCVDKEVIAETIAARKRAWIDACLKVMTQHELDELERLSAHNVQLVDALATLSMHTHNAPTGRCGAMLVGPAGTGKTTQINLWLRDRYHHHTSQDWNAPGAMRFLEPALLRALQSYEFERPGGIDPERIARVPVLIIDEMGTSQGHSLASGMFYEVIDARYRARRTTIFSSNFTLRELTQGSFVADQEGHPLYDERLATRILEMILWEEGYAQLETFYRSKEARRGIYEF